MTLRLLAASLGIVLVLGLAGDAAAQKKAKSAQTESDDSATASTAKAKTEGDSATSKADSEAPKAQLETATFGEGCFWCAEAVFERTKGVKSVVSGYSGGNVPFPTYEQVHTGLTGHAEAVQIEFDPSVVSYETLLKIFWASHDPTTLNMQGDDVGTQYRSVIFYHSEAQRLAALKSYQELKARRAFRSQIVTELLPAKEFYPAELYHQDYYRNNRGSDYSLIHIAPKLKKLKLK
jgi:peptide-methionine (S)-S-oxide reductase